MLRTLALAALSGCAPTAADIERSDRQAYQASARLHAADPTAAAHACHPIADAELRAECVSLAVGRLAATNSEAGAWCDTLEDPHWQDLCRLEVIDGRRLVGPEAIAACARAQTFLERCLSHALRRHVGRQWRSVLVGEERAYVEWVDAQVKTYGLHPSAARIHTPFLVGIIVDRMGSKQLPDDPPRDLTGEECGTAPRSLCVESLRTHLRSATNGVNLSTICNQTLSQETLHAAGLPGWGPAYATEAQELWAQRCRTHTGRSPTIQR